LLSVQHVSYVRATGPPRRPRRAAFGGIGRLENAGGGTRRGDRSPGAAWSPAPMESVDRWPLAIPDTQIPGGSRPAGTAVRRRVRGVRTPHLRAVCRSPASAREGGLPGSPACGPALRSYSGGNWMAARVPPVRRAGSLRPGARSPLPPIYVPSTPSGGVGLLGDRVRPVPPPGTQQELVIWLILPVVICLSQRLSHACLSISTLYCETANGSLNQLSFI
jgi:hypothetical protein